MSQLDDLLDTVAKLNHGDLRYEIRTLRAVQEWALDHLGIDYRTGDRVEIVSERPSQSKDGWRSYAEALAPGRTGEAGEISFNTHLKRWDCLLRMDRSWSVSDGWGGDRPVHRYWKGPVSETPEGFEPPPLYEQEHYPDGKIKVFAMPVEWLRKYEARPVGKRSAIGPHHAPRCPWRGPVVTTDDVCNCGVNA